MRFDLLLDEARALALPEHPHPNPRVGALVVDEGGAIVGRGAHATRGGPHAETLALESAGAAARGSTVVVTLEPCAHEGTTPPCTEDLIEAGVRRVVIGAGDPDHRVSGAGIAALRAAGIEVVLGPDPEGAEELDPGYFHHRRTGRPMVTLKLALTLDGQAAAADGSSQWITGEEARRDAHRLRARSDAVAVGAGTVLADDPRLTVRSGDIPMAQPVPVVVAGRRPLPASAVVFGRDPIVYAPASVDLPGDVTILGDGHRVDLEAALADLGKREIIDLLVEGGPTLAASLEAAGLVDRMVLYLAGSVAGGVGRPAFASVFETIGTQRQVEITEFEQLGTDLKVVCRRGGR